MSSRCAIGSKVSSGGPLGGLDDLDLGPVELLDRALEVGGLRDREANVVAEREA
jgi:hypothetical protein